ncbi:hypothetical protein SBA2_450022 [Acidobacteriia bacterium SbA2]|nr:hypothetical protein SBA2_450022 [Acidobacteriia bacterium SbA2]
MIFGGVAGLLLPKGFGRQAGDEEPRPGLKIVGRLARGGAGMLPATVGGTPAPHPSTDSLAVIG